MAVMDYWNTKREVDAPINKQFDIEKWMKVSEQERLNLIYLDILKQFKWFLDYQERGLLSSFSNDANLIDNSQKCDDMATAIYDTSLIVIDPVKLQKKIKFFEREDLRERANYLAKVP